MYCPSCGNKIPVRAKFCPSCGLNIKEFIRETIQEEDSEILGEKTNKEIILEEGNDLECLFLGKEKSKVLTQGDCINLEENMNFNFNIYDNIVDEENKENENILEKILNKKDNIIKKLKEKEYYKYLQKLNEFLNTIGLKIKNTQNKIYNIFNSKYEYVFKEESIITNLIVILTSFIVFIPVYYLMKNSDIISTGFSKTIMLLIVFVGTIIHQLAIMLGPFITLKVGGLNYINNLDKFTSKAIILTVSFIISIIKFISFILIGNITSIEFIFFGQYSFRILLITIIMLLLETTLIQSLVWNKFKKDNYIKVFYTIFLVLVASEILTYLVARPLIFILLGLL